MEDSFVCRGYYIQAVVSPLEFILEISIIESLVYKLLESLETYL